MESLPTITLTFVAIFQVSAARLWRTHVQRAEIRLWAVHTSKLICTDASADSVHNSHISHQYSVRMWYLHPLASGNTLGSMCNTSFILHLWN